jgi:hypothetical protein
MGVTLLTAMETNVRTDLKDLDASAYLWTTAEIDRHIAHAVNDYQRLIPAVGSLVLVVESSASAGPTTPITTRQVVPHGGDYLWTLRVEYPIDQDPPTYVVFREELPDAGSLYFPVGDPPNVGDNLRIWYAKAHVLTTAESTILTEHEELIALGAVAYAATAATRYAVGRLNASAWTPRGLQLFAQERMAAYQGWLGELKASYSASGLPMPQWGDYPSNWIQV